MTEQLRKFILKFHGNTTALENGWYSFVVVMFLAGCFGVYYTTPAVERLLMAPFGPSVFSFVISTFGIVLSYLVLVVCGWLTIVSTPTRAIYRLKGAVLKQYRQVPTTADTVVDGSLMIGFAVTGYMTIGTANNVPGTGWVAVSVEFILALFLFFIPFIAMVISTAVNITMRQTCRAADPS